MIDAKVFLFDLDGTVYLGKDVIGNVPETLSYLRKKGKRVGFITNNSSETTCRYKEKLKGMGLYENGDFFYSSLDCAKDYFKKTKPDAKIYALASEEIKDHLKSEGLDIRDAKDADTVLLTFDKELSFEKIINANALLLNESVFYVATHPDTVCPMESGNIPDVGSFIALFEKSSGRTPDFFTGKPYPVMGEYVKELLGVPPEQIAMVGDMLSTDMALGKNSGFKTVLVLSGETKAQDLIGCEIKPDYVLDTVDGLRENI